MNEAGKNRRRGVVLRLDISADEYRALKYHALDEETTVPKLLAVLVRRELEKRQRTTNKPK